MVVNYKVFFVELSVTIYTLFFLVGICLLGIFFVACTIYIQRIKQSRDTAEFVP